MAFGKAFAAARKAGKKEFTYNGKRYNTKLAEDTPKKAPTPTENPRRAAKRNTGRDRHGPKAAKKAIPATGRDRHGPKQSAAQKAPSFRDKIKKATSGMGVLQSKYKRK